MIQIDQLIKSKRRTISLQIKPDGALIVRVPLRVDMKRVYNFIKEKNKWIITKQSEIKNKFLQREQLRSELGAPGLNEVLFLGEKIKLELKKSELILWYKREALKHLSARVDFFTKKFFLNYSRVKINSAKTRWGSCSSRGNINFSWRLIMAPPQVVDYVVIHEIAHLKHKNHSQKFWNFVAEMMPDFAQHRKWLKKHGFLLDI